MRVFSFGGGVQSTAVMVLQARGKVNYDYFVFANVGTDSENPDTLKYIENFTKPFCQEHEIRLVEVAKTGSTLRRAINEQESSIKIPMWLENEGKRAPGNRTCTYDYKIKVINKWIRSTNFEGTATVGIGFSTDEIHRARIEPPDQIYAKIVKVKEYPLIDLRLSRRDCHNIISDSGLPKPPKSSCYFCPFHRDAFWMELREDHPELFADAVEIDYKMRERRYRLGKDAIWMHQSLKPLDVAIGSQTNFFDEMCESGYCHT